MWGQFFKLTSPFSQSLKSLAGEAVESVRQGIELTLFTVISQQAEVLSDRVSWLPSVYRTARLPRVMSGSPGCCSSHYLIASHEIHGPWKEHRSWWKGPKVKGPGDNLGGPDSRVTNQETWLPCGETEAPAWGLRSHLYELTW